MRFVLDNDVDVRVCRVLRQAGHDCWTIGNAHLAVANDDDVGVYADDKHACLITHDGEATERRKKNLYGQLVRLDCDHPDAIEVVTGRMEEMLQKLSFPEVVVRVRRDSVRIEAPPWLRDA